MYDYKSLALYGAQKAIELLQIDSPSGFTKNAILWVKNEFELLGFQTAVTNAGSLLIDIGGEGEGLMLAAHTDTLGAMVAEIKSNGRLRLSPIGGLKACNTETENARIYTRGGKVLTGTLQLINASAHVNGKLDETERSFDTIELVPDEDVSTKADTEALGISVGDFVCPDPRSQITASGYIKSRYLDDKLSVGIILALARYIKESDVKPSRHIYALISVYEEVGHGVNKVEDVTEFICVDMGCVGEGLSCTEKQVSICAKDAGGPYDYDVVGKLINAAKREGADYAVDVYRYYSSDVDVAVKAGHDVRHGCIGAGVYASHGYERSHLLGVENTLKTLKGYIYG